MEMVPAILSGDKISCRVFYLPLTPERSKNAPPASTLGVTEVTWTLGITAHPDAGGTAASAVARTGGAPVPPTSLLS